MNSLQCNNCKNYKLYEYKKGENYVNIDTNVYKLHILKSKEKCNIHVLFYSKVYKYQNLSLIHNCCVNKLYEKSKSILLMFKKYNYNFSYINQEIFKLNSNQFNFQFLSTQLPTIIDTLPDHNPKELLNQIIKMKSKYKKTINLYKEKNNILNDLLEMQNKRIRYLEDTLQTTTKKVKT